MSDSVQSYGQQPTRFLCPWDSPGKNIAVGCHFLLQGSSYRIINQYFTEEIPEMRENLNSLVSNDTSSSAHDSNGYILTYCYNHFYIVTGFYLNWSYLYCSKSGPYQAAQPCKEPYALLPLGTFIFSSWWLEQSFISQNFGPLHLANSHAFCLRSGISDDHFLISSLQVWYGYFSDVLDTVLTLPCHEAYCIAKANLLVGKVSLSDCCSGYFTHSSLLSSYTVSGGTRKAK